MKICVTSSGQSQDDAIDPRFGRCQYFFITDTDDGQQSEAIQNPAATAGGGAGIQAAQLVANKGVEAVLTGNVGPNAFNTLQAAGLKIVTGLGGMTVKEAIEGFKAGRYQYINAPSVKSHHGTSGSAGVADSNATMNTGMGRGRGMGGRGGMATQQPRSSSAKEEELKTLKEEAQKMKENLNKVQERIDKLIKTNV